MDIRDSRKDWEECNLRNGKYYGKVPLSCIVVEFTEDVADFGNREGGIGGGILGWG